MKNIFISLITLLICFLAGEVVVRVLIVKTVDGNEKVFGKWLRPYKIPKKEILNTIIVYHEHINDSNSFVSQKYDSLLGWKPNENYDDYNIQGIRVGKNNQTQFTELPDTNILRIAIFGDSYTHCDEVPYRESWGKIMQDLFAEDNIKTEVLNFGVGGYGIDQAYLRWEIEGKKFSPDIVILGFQTYDLERSLIVNKNHSPYADNPFSKPKFNNDCETLINYPAFSPIKLMETINSINNDEIDKLPYIQYNYNYDEIKDNYDNKWYLYSKLFNIAQDILTNNRYTLLQKFDDMYDFKNDYAHLNLNIIKKFNKSVNISKADFLVVDIPKYLDLKPYLEEGVALPYEHFLDSIDNYADVIKPILFLKKYYDKQEDDDLFKLGGKKSLFAPKGHYSAIGNKIIAKAIVSHILNPEKITK